MCVLASAHWFQFWEYGRTGRIDNPTRMDSVKSDGTSAVAGKNAMELVQFGAMVDFMWLAAATISEPWRPQVTGSSWHVMDLFDTYVYVYI